jgi:hypothetical protein
MSFILTRNPHTRGVRKGTVYINRCNVNDRNGKWFRLGIWKLRGMRRGTGKEICPSCKEEEKGYTHC